MKNQSFYVMKRVFVLSLFILLGMPFLWAQTIQVTGKVVDTANEPMIGVSVLEKGTSNGVITDLDGNYRLTVSPNAVLVYSFVGYTTQEKKAVGGAMNITMKEDNQLLDEVVVVGYGVQKKSSLTGSISSVKSEDMENRTIISAQEALQGKTAGIQVVTTSGAPGSAPNIRVRGYSSNADMSPLYVVDGIIVKDIGGIEPTDIQSMEVLKDASSAAIYGAQAGNGVVLITTKKGNNIGSNWGKLSYDFQYSSQSLARTPKMMNAEQYAEYMSATGAFSQTTIDTYWDGKTNTNWFDEVFDHSAMYKHNVSYSTGSDKGSVYVSTSYLTNNGIIVGDDDKYTRLNGVVNVDYKIKPWFKISTSNNIERNTRQSVNVEGLNDTFLMDPLTPAVYAPDQLPTNMQSVLNQGKTILQDGNGNYYSISNFYSFANPLANNASSQTKSEAFNVNGNFAADLTPIKGLTLTTKLGYFLTASNSSTYSNDYYASPQRYRDYVGLSQSNSNSVYYQWDNYINYMTTFAKRHDVTAMLGHSFTKRTSNNTNGTLTANGEDAVLKDDQNLFGYLDFASSSATRGNSGRKTENTSESYFGRFTYSYDGKYMLQFSLRADAFDMSKLPITNRWGYFPAGSLAWVVSQEKFWEGMPKWFTHLKFRGSWGKNGSIGALNNYLYATSMATSGKYAYGNDSDYKYITGSSPSSMGNDELTWETSTQLNIGLDARFLSDRLTLTADYFNKKTDDLLVSGLKPSLIAGGTFSPMNAGSVSNKGLELELGWRDKIGKDFNYSIRTNLSTLKNEVTYLNKGIDYIEGHKLLNDLVTIFEEGSEVWHFYGYKFTGIDPSNGEPTFEDLDGDGEITTNDRTNIGSAIPNVTYGVTLSASYKGFDALVFGTGTSGNKIYQCLFSSDRAMGNRIYGEWYENRWTEDNKGGDKPAATADISKYMISSAMVKDGSFFKIKQIQLGYTLPKTLMSKISVSNLRLYVSLDDWFTFTKYKGFDPESSSAGTGSGQGIDVSTYPISKKFVVGVNLTF